jgi:hypothetical protein
MEVDRVGAIYDAIERLADDANRPASAETKEALEQAATLLGARIKAMGGTSAERKQRARLEEKAEKLAAKAQSVVSQLRRRDAVVYGPSAE